jgi:HEAT repeat protein
VQFGDRYEIPEEVVRRPYSPAFAQFLHHWFVDSFGLSRGEVDLAFLNDLTPEEIEVARELLRRNLKLKYTHIIKGVAAVRDLRSLPLLRTMLSEEPDLGRRLTIAGTLWKLARDPLFIECLDFMKESENAHLKQAHIHQILWLENDWAIDLLIDLLDDKDKLVRSMALKMLNSLEFDRSMVGDSELPRQASDYRLRRHEQAFRELMVRHIQHFSTTW